MEKKSRKKCEPGCQCGRHQRAPHSQDAKDKMIAAWEGRRKRGSFSDESRAKMAAARKKCEPGCTCKRHSKPKASEETRAKMRAAHAGRSTACAPGCTCNRHTKILSDEHKKSIIAANKKRAGVPTKKCPEGCTCGRHVPRYRGGSRKGRKFSREAKTRIALAAIEARGKMTEEERQRLRDQLREQRMDPEFESKRREGLAKFYKQVEFSERTSSKLEYAVAPKLEAEGYTHNCGIGAVKIGKKIPDFIDHPNRRVIEVFGSYWHVPEEESEVIGYYEQLGWKCRVIWDTDI